MRSTDAAEAHAFAEVLRHADGDLLGARGEAVLLRAALDVEHGPDAACGLDVVHGVQHRHLVGFAAPRHPRHDRHQIPGALARVHRPQPSLDGLSVEAVGVTAPSTAPRAGPACRGARTATECAKRRAARGSTAWGWCCGRTAPGRASGSGSCRRCRSAPSRSRARRRARGPPSGSARRTCRRGRRARRRSWWCGTVRRRGHDPRERRRRTRVRSKFVRPSVRRNPAPTTTTSRPGRSTHATRLSRVKVIQVESLARIVDALQG